MSQNSKNKPNLDTTQFFDEIEFLKLLSLIWKRKWIIVLCGLVFGLAALVVAWNKPNLYTSESLIVSAESSQNNGMSTISNQLGGLASLAGVNLKDNSSNKAKLALNILNSRKFIGDFIESRSILPDLMAVDAWVEATNEIVYVDNLYDLESDNWVAFDGGSGLPSRQRAIERFKQSLDVNDDKDSGLITISIEHKSPLVAKNWVQWLIEDINQEMRLRDVSEAEMSIEFLTAQISEIKITDIRQVLYNLIEEQTKTIMFANVRDEYIFKIIDPPISPETPSSPKRLLIIVIGSLLGLALGILLALFLAVKNDKP